MRDYYEPDEPDDDERPEPAYEHDDDYTTTEADIVSAENSYERSLERQWV